MRVRFYKAELSASVASIALIIGSGAAVAEQQSPGQEANEKFMAVVQAMQSDASNSALVEANSPSEVDVAVPDGLFRKLTVATNGVYRFEAPANSGIKLFIDEVLAIDTTGEVTDPDAEPIKALQALSAGDHAIRIESADGGAELLEMINFGAIGSEPRNLALASSALAPMDGAKLAARNSALMPSGKRAANAAENGPRRFGLAGSSDKPGFTLGGSSSKLAKRGPAPATGGGAEGANGGPGTAAMRMASLPRSSSASPAAPAAAAGGGVSSVPSVSGGGGTTNPAGTPGAPGTPSATPTIPTAAPAPTPTPTPINPGTTPTAETVQASPLSPPTNPEITQAVQLTSAGNVNSQVPNSGSTLFGAVMNNSMFDIVNVSVSGSNRTTTVDVGPMTGQFAVRLFPEDFASSNQVQVTLTGASSASDEVEATPVTYTVTGMQAQDGVSQALSRLTFGATPELYARVRAIGFQNYVEEQLNPAAINDAAFNAMNPNSIVDPNESNGNTLLRKLVHEDIAHAAFSEKQLQNVMGQFWANHFHAVTKNTNMYSQNIDDRRFFRENAFATFRELLLYSARSPLMSQYLDNDENRFRENRENNGINENYGREILELSTLGVEAGYTSADVDMVSRVFSGWRYERTNPNAENTAQLFAFQFFPEDHDPQDKLIPFLGTTIAGREGAAGVQEGEELIALLANHPSTQSRTCRKIVQLLVADDAPAGFVQSCIAAWGVDGDIDAMLRAILLNPAYINTAAYQRNKAKTPFEFSVSVIRTFGARPDNPTEDDFWNRFREAHEQAGYNFVRFPVPTGLPEVSAAWLNSASMIASYNRVTDVIESRQNYGIDPMADIADAGLETAEEVAAYLLAIGTADKFTLSEFENVVAVLKGDDGIFEPRVDDETRALEKAMGLIVVSPSFQLQ
ncbi:MAG: DUF1800 family protein [Pseudomonadota bacterium]